MSNLSRVNNEIVKFLCHELNSTLYLDLELKFEKKEIKIII